MKDKKIIIKGYARIGDTEFELGITKGKPIMKDGKKIGEVTDMYWENGELHYEGVVETDELPNMSIFYKKERND